MSKKKDASEKTSIASTNGEPSDAHDRDECFVIMPISDPEGYEEGHFQHVYEDLLVPACERAGYRAIRADQVRQTNLIHLDVLQKIIDSPMVICDLSSRNPNVLFELGLRQAFDRPVVLVQEIGTEPIFDINPLRYTNYHREMLYRQVIEDQDNISSALAATREDIGNSKSVNSIVKLLSLTRPASLVNISEGDKDTALLQLIMTEIGNLRSDIKATRFQSTGSESLDTSDISFNHYDISIEGTRNQAQEFSKALLDRGLSIEKPKIIKDPAKKGYYLCFNSKFKISPDVLKILAEDSQLALNNIAPYVSLNRIGN